MWMVMKKRGVCSVPEEISENFETDSCEGRYVELLFGLPQSLGRCRHSTHLFSIEHEVIPRYFLHYQEFYISYGFQVFPGHDYKPHVLRGNLPVSMIPIPELQVLLSPNRNHPYLGWFLYEDLPGERISSSHCFISLQSFRSRSLMMIILYFPGSR